MLEAVNRIFIILVLLAATAGILFSVGALFLPGLLGSGSGYEELDMAHNQKFSLEPYAAPSVTPHDSPYLINLTIHSPSLSESDLIFLDIYSEGRLLYSVDCLSGFASAGGFAGRDRIECSAYLPYTYSPSGSYRIFGVFSHDNIDYSTSPINIDADWRAYESDFLGFSMLMGVALAGVYLFIMLPVAFFVLKSALGMKHETLLPGEYSLDSLVHPLRAGKTLLQKSQAFLVSPYFWALEFMGILIILLYMAVSAQAWKSASALTAFVLSGLMALILPFLWCAAWWYADVREREPLRIIMTFFLWGMVSALMSIGLNSAAGEAFEAVGLGFLGVFLVAPILEEFYKGAGLSLLSEHHEFDSVEDGIAFGFVIGMGFAFIENWIYFIGNPLGSDVSGWFSLFIIRSIIFSANHGLYTAITGGIIGYLIEKKFRAPGLGLLAGVPLAALFHAMHNSSGLLSAIFGGSGILVYCCFLIPLFDYGGLIVLILFFIRALIRPR